MKNLPEGMLEDRDNQVYYDTEREQFYIIKWTEWGNGDRAERHYINAHGNSQIKKCTFTSNEARLNGLNEQNCIVCGQHWLEHRAY